MIRKLEFAVFCLAAVALHMGIAVMAERPKAAASGSDGSPATAAAAAGELATLIESWDAEPARVEILPEQGPGSAEEAVEPSEQLTDVDTATAVTSAEASSVLHKDLPEIIQTSRPNDSLAQEPLALATQAPADTASAQLPTNQQNDQRPSTPNPIALKAPAQPALNDFLKPEIEPEETSPAPITASIPIKKPKPPRELVRVQKKPKKRAAALQAAPQRVEKTPKAAGASTDHEPQVAALPAPSSATAQPAGYSKAAIADATAAYKAAVGRAIGKKKRYPNKARRRGVEGRPIVRIVLTARGRLVSASLAKSSGSDLLDRAALDAAKSVRQYPRIPKEMDRTQATLRFPISFQLR